MLSQFSAHLLPVISVSTNKDTSSSLFSPPPCSYTRPRPFEATSWVRSENKQQHSNFLKIHLFPVIPNIITQTMQDVIEGESVYNICLINTRDSVSHQATIKNISSEYWKSLRLTVPRNWSPMNWVVYVRHGLKNQHSTTWRNVSVGSLMLLRPRNLAVFEIQFLLEYYTQRANISPITKLH